MENITNPGTYEFQEIFRHFDEEPEQLMAASEAVVRENEDRNWYVTELPSGLWAAWDNVNTTAEVFVSCVEAVEYHRNGYEVADDDDLEWLASENIESVRLSLDVDLHSHGEDENFPPAEIEEAGGLNELILTYAEFHAERIAEIHGIEKADVYANPSRYVDVTITESEQ